MFPLLLREVAMDILASVARALGSMAGKAVDPLLLRRN